MKIIGLNIRHPWSQMILQGQKTIETRTYPCPEKHVGQPIALIETYGKKRPARLIGVVWFGSSFQYPNQEQFYRDYRSHCVDSKSEYCWEPGKPKWGWPITRTESITTELSVPRHRGIVWTQPVEIPNRDLTRC